MLSDEWLSRYGLLENFNASVTRTRTGNGNGNVDDRGDCNSSMHFVQSSQKQNSNTKTAKTGNFHFFHYKRMESISCHSNQSSYPINTKKTQLFFPPTFRWCMCNMRTIGPAVSEKKIFEIVEDGRTPEHGYTISSPMSLWLR